MMARGGAASIATLLLLACAGGVQAQDAAAEPPPEDRWSFTVAPYLWAISLDGDATVAGLGADVDAPFSDTVKDLSFGAMLLLDARRGRFGVGVNGVFTRVTPDDDVGAIEIDITADLGQVAVAPYFRALDWDFGRSASGRSGVSRLPHQPVRPADHAGARIPRAARRLRSRRVRLDVTQHVPILGAALRF
jgi:hypothetical protein